METSRQFTGIIPNPSLASRLGIPIATNRDVTEIRTLVSDGSTIVTEVPGYANPQFDHALESMYKAGQAAAKPIRVDSFQDRFTGEVHVQETNPNTGEMERRTFTDHYLETVRETARQEVVVDTPVIEEDTRSTWKKMVTAVAWKAAVWATFKLFT